MATPTRSCGAPVPSPPPSCSPPTWCVKGCYISLGMLHHHRVGVSAEWSPGDPGNVSSADHRCQYSGSGSISSRF
eukprot:5431923-Pyramimonas_sp.AAC.1